MMVTAAKTSLKKWIGAASNFITLIPSILILQMLAIILFDLNSKGLYQSSTPENKVVVLCSCPWQNVKLGSFTL